MQRPYYRRRKRFTRNQIDLNCDLAQKWGPYKSLTEEESLLPFVSSVNISCGGHAGDPESIVNALKLAKARNLSVGAHISYPDLQNFGRKEMRFDINELRGIVVQQISYLEGLSRAYDISLTHFRPHGAMYYKCAADPIFSEQLARVVASYSPWLTFVAPPTVGLNTINNVSGLKAVGEVHLDKPYRRDGTIYRFGSSRYVSFDFAMAQARSLIYQNKLIVEGNRKIRVSFKTIHFSQDRPYSLQLAENVHRMLKGGPVPFAGISKIHNLQIADLKMECSIGNIYD